jgi:hypothetical protein
MRRICWSLLLSALLLPVPGTGRAANAADAQNEPAEPAHEPAEAAGVWRGELEVDGRTLNLVLRVRRGGGGVLTGTLDGLGPALRNLPVTSLIVIEDVLSFQVPQVLARFAGNFASEGEAIRGNWSQDDRALPLILYRDPDRKPAR